MYLPIYHFLKIHGSRFNNIIEAGAHKGRDTLKLATTMPQATIYAFEPVPDLLEQHEQRTAHVHNIRRFGIALGQKSADEQTLHVSSGRSDACSSFLEPTDLIKKPHNVYAEPITFAQDIAVPVTTLKEWAQKQQVLTIDFIWLDAQGSELAILRGAEDLLHTVTAAYVEVNLVERYRGAPTEQELINYCAQFGLTCVDRDEPKHGKRNLLFIGSAK